MISVAGDAEGDLFGIAPTNFKIGLLNNMDLQIIVETYNIQRTPDREARTPRRDLRFRRCDSALENQLLGQRRRQDRVRGDALRETAD
ncbi:MAG: hypothetical protein H0X04_06160 [Chthoniobacterales bacterium]|nr:hypothetical protein [Chthoniobacterales bacterium]